MLKAADKKYNYRLCNFLRQTLRFSILASLFEAVHLSYSMSSMSRACSSLARTRQARLELRMLNEPQRTEDAETPFELRRRSSAIMSDIQEPTEAPQRTLQQSASHGIE